MLWQDRFEPGGAIYHVRNFDPAYNYDGQPGLKELMENLDHAITSCEGLVRVVIVRAKDANASPRAIAEAFPQEKLIMKVVELDKAAGTATLKRVDAGV
jgi:hypothetical protein